MQDLLFQIFESRCNRVVVVNTQLKTHIEQQFLVASRQFDPRVSKRVGEIHFCVVRAHSSVCSFGMNLGVQGAAIYCCVV